MPFLMRVTTLVFHSKEISSFNVTVKYGDMTDLKDYVSRGKKTQISFASFYNYLLHSQLVPIVSQVLFYKVYMN